MIGAWPHRYALGVLVVIVDQLSKWVVEQKLTPGEVIEVTPYLNLVLVHNRGISFGLLSDVDAPTAWPLVAVALVIVVVLLVWLTREQRWLTRLALQLVIAGALGNVSDRVRQGMVVDFLDFHLNSYHWPAFNVADVAVVVGALLLLLDGLVGGDRPAEREGEKA